MSHAVYQYDRPGVWTSSHGIFYQFAYDAFVDFARTIEGIERCEEDIRNQTSAKDQDVLDSLIVHETSELEAAAYRYAESSFLFLCMTIESFLNHYGVKRLGSTFYRRNVERLGITEKLALLLLICLGVKLKPDDPLLTKVRSLFDRRNQLVHPKTRRIDFDKLHEFVSKHPRDLGLRSDLEDLEFIIERLCSLDPHIRRDFEFKRPNKTMRSDKE